MSDDGWEEGYPLPEERLTAPKYEVVCPKPGIPVRVTLLGNRLLIRRKHYDRSQSRPIPCTGHPDTCVYCRGNQSSYATGYIAAVNTTGRKRVIFQVSASAILALRDHKLTLLSLRGQKIISERLGTRKNARQGIEGDGIDANANLPDEFDPRPTLAEMWQLALARTFRLEEFARLRGTPGRIFVGEG